jgi:small redox-active disulfide protein 2
MKIEVFGPGCHKCNTLEKMVKDALTELNIQAEVVKISDINEMVSRGVMFTPALIIEGNKKSEGKVPSSDDIKKWLKEGNK